MSEPDASRDDQLTTEDKDAALDRVVLEGRPRLHRSWHDLAATSVVAGLEVGFGVLALLTVEEATGSRELAALAFAVGFIALRLGHSELFTEGFHVPVVVAAAKEASWWQVGRLWWVSLVGNLAGGFVIAWLLAESLPRLHAVSVEVGAEFADADLDLQLFLSAVLGGAAITLLTRMHVGTDDDVARIIASVATAFVIVGGRLTHSILDSLLIFVGIFSGAHYGLGDWLPWFVVAVVGNLLGGIVLVTLLRLVRSEERLQQWRRTGPHTRSGSPEDPS